MQGNRDGLALRNICTEFSNSFLISAQDNERILALTIATKDLDDLYGVLYPYGLLLENISYLSNDEALVVFSRFEEF